MAKTVAWDADELEDRLDVEEAEGRLHGAEDASPYELARRDLGLRD